MGVGGLAVSLALKDTLSDLFGGINILLSKTMKEGDYVELSNGIKGMLKTLDGDIPLYKKEQIM
ncbi:MAG: hypothetical protein CM1200mP31_4970 [Candidatus Neomarinimicrobiota bacterium]|nr:MAG: hypothetical protein CM1200mP31_4970 [Candidatus Neomarinimicrobiota bacterium]